jgi:hypothetical protein
MKNEHPVDLSTMNIYPALYGGIIFIDQAEQEIPYLPIFVDLSVAKVKPVRCIRWKTNILIPFRKSKSQYK